MTDSWIQAVDELNTVRDWVRWGASRLHQARVWLGHGTDDVFDEALLLVCHVTGIPHARSGDYADARLTRDERLTLAELLRRRIEERVPAAYLTGEAWFCGLVFQVDPRVLIPRSPLCELIETCFEPWQEAPQLQRVLDLATGSGCIAIAIAHHCPDAQVDASDLSPDALAVARANVDRHGLGDRVRLIQSDVFDDLQGEAYDVIVSNPPYVARAEYEVLAPEYGHEPGQGLLAGEQGLDVVNRILAGAAAHLQPHGILVTEVGSAQEALSERYPQVPFMWLEFDRGGDGVFVLTRDQLRAHQEVFEAAVGEQATGTGSVA